MLVRALLILIPLTAVPAAGVEVVPEVHAGFPDVFPPAVTLPAYATRDYILPAPDVAAAKARPLASSGVERIGVVQAAPEVFGIAHGIWTPTNQGRWAWAITLSTPGATGIRVHLTHLDLPAGATLYVVSAEGDAIAVPGAGWSPTTFGDQATLLCLVPSAAAKKRTALEVNQTAYLFADWSALRKDSGNCNNDLACAPDWKTPAMGVGGIGTIGGLDAIWCTGSLIADDVPETDIPWFLTANHCVNNQSTAASVEVYWQFTAEDCGGAPPAINSVPRTTGGATLIAGSSVSFGTDVALLRLNESPPEGLVWLGWTTTPPEVGNSTVCIHHPSGDDKKISFGTITDTGSPSANDERLRPIARFHEVRWDDGTTEPGSSGSPLLLPTGVIIGQLWGGRASCGRPEEPDYYGRFDQSYALLAPYLGTPPSGAFDVDKNGIVNAADLQIVINASLHQPDAAWADVDNSGRIDASDVEATLRAMLSSV